MHEADKSTEHFPQTKRSKLVRRHPAYQIACFPEPVCSERKGFLRRQTKPSQGEIDHANQVRRTENSECVPRENFLDGFKSDDFRIQFSFKYNFSKTFTY